MDVELKRLIARVEAGDCESLAVLADWLESHGDPRSAMAREVMRFDSNLIADMLYLIRSKPISDDWAMMALSPEIGLLAGIGSLITGLITGKEFRTGSSSKLECLSDVTQALALAIVSTDVARAITLTRRIKRDHLLAQFTESAPSN